MLSRGRPITDALRALLLAISVLAAAVFVSSSSRDAHAASVSQLQKQISSGRGHISSLSGTVKAASGRLYSISASIAALGRRIDAIKADLNAKRAQLAKVQAKLNEARTRLAQLEAYQARAESVLAQQLVATYESNKPDVVTVVLTSTGFQDLLERLDFMRRVRKENINIIGQVRDARHATAAEATYLGKLEVREHTLVLSIQAKRNELFRAATSLMSQRAAVARFRATKNRQLNKARDSVGHLQHQLGALLAEQARLAAQRAAAAARASASAGPGFTPTLASGSAPVSSGGFTFPLPKSAASPPGTWSPDDGVDISAPGDTPEYAVCSGTIVLHGIGGFGPWAPVLHCDGSLAGYSYVYYGHAGPAGQLSIGTHVSAGQVLGSVGPGIVGISTGPHLELGFADSSGAPVGPGSAGTMMSLLQAAYNG